MKPFSGRSCCRFPARHCVTATRAFRFPVKGPKLLLKTSIVRSSTTFAGPVFQSPPVSLFRRILTFGTIGMFFTAAGFVMAVTSSSYSALNGILNHPTDAETLAMFQPADEEAKQVDGFLKNHPIAKELRKDPKIVESRPHLKIPEQFRSHNLMSGLMSGPGKLVVPPITFLEKGGSTMTMLMYLGGDMCGYPGFVHGGALATILDEGLARCSFQALPNKIGMTAKLNINYRAPLPGNTYVVLRATTTKVEGRKVWVTGRLESLPQDGGESKLFVEAETLFIEPKQAKNMAKLSPVVGTE